MVRLEDGKLILAVHLPRWERAGGMDWIRMLSRSVSEGTFGGWRLEVAFQLLCSAGLKHAPQPSSLGYLRVLRGDWGGASCCPLSHPADEGCIWHFSYHFERGWLRLGLAPGFFFLRGRSARFHGKTPRLCSHLAAWPWLEAGVINLRSL